ncbi:hypothetical protein [Tautonia rosea]|nr:hypothetical protein [Tautonia rosea]
MDMVAWLPRADRSARRWRRCGVIVSDCLQGYVIDRLIAMVQRLRS